MRHVLLALLAGCLPAVGFAGGDAGSGGPADAAPDGPPMFDRCASGESDLLRYASVIAPGSAWSWADARTACVRLGMDLAVQNDAHDGTADPDQWPAWVGLTVASVTAPWVAVDGCPAVSPASSTGSACGVLRTGALEGDACDGGIARALCETPHPDASSCAHDPTSETYVASPAPLAYADAVAYCQAQQAHLVVIDSHTELAALAALVPTTAGSDFWIGEKWDGSAWRSETGCPGEFSWVDGGAATATLAGAESCTAALVATGGADPTAVELQGQALVACDAAKLALCERE